MKHSFPLQLSNYISDLWSSFDPAVQGAIISALATALTAIVLIWQVRTQAKNAINQNTKNEQTKLKLSIYNHIIENRDDYLHSESEFRSYLTKIQMQIQNSIYLNNAGENWSPPDARIGELFSRHDTFSNSAIDIINTIEKWQIVEPRIDIFQTAINSAMHDVRQAYSFRLIPTIIQALPIDHPTKNITLPWQPPSQQNYELLKTKIDDVVSAIDNLGMYVDDFRREMQNALLGELFKHRVPDRKPLNKRLISVTLSKYDALNQYFHNETDWGRSYHEAEQRVLKEIGNTTVPEEKTSIIQKIKYRVLKIFG